MKKHKILIIVAVFSISSLVLGCEAKQDESPADDEPVAEVAEADGEEPAATADDEPRELVQKARELGPLAEMIRENPAALDAWLDEQDMTEAELEELLFDISQDTEASVAYSESR